MTNQEHMNVLRQGTEKWNQWRSEHPEIHPNLREADLTNTDLTCTELDGTDLIGAYLDRANLTFADLTFAKLIRANLTRANLTEANLTYAKLIRAYLRGADLTEADLTQASISGADLTRTDLTGAHLREANLTGANLTETNFTGADLTGAKLTGANLTRTNLTRTNLRRATFSNTTLAELDLRSVKGLLEIQHWGPSIIQLHSIQLPQDGSALHVLRGAGIPDAWIDFYRASMMHPIQYHSCFISYASENEDAAKRLHADLQANGVRCWFAPHDLKPGDYFREKIDEAIHLQDKLLLILSEQSVASKWVRYEVRQALDREVNQERTILFPIRLDNSVLHTKDGWAHALRSSRHIGDFTCWQEHQGYQEAFTQLLKHLKDETK